MQLAEKSRGTTRDGKPFFTCKFRDARRTVGAVPIWEDSPLFEEAQEWQVGQFFKVRATFIEHEKYGPQLDIEQIRLVEDRDRADGFTELDFTETLARTTRKRCSRNSWRSSRRKSSTARCELWC